MNCRKIRHALKGPPEGRTLAEDTNIAEELLTTFRGRNRWPNGFAAALTFALFGLAVWAVVQFLGAEAPRDPITWGGLSLICMIMVGLLKVFFWLEMHTYRVLRQVKRVELLLVQRER